MKRLTVLAAVMGLMVGVLYIGGAEAYDKVQLLRCKTTKQCSGYDLTGADLTGATWTDGTTCKQGSIGQCNK